jgi:hypothetical protein
MEGDLKALRFREGSEVFFAGMFTPHMGSRRNFPIVRFGKLCLITDEKIRFDGEDRDLYLIEGYCFGGNSGAPVFFLTGYENPPGIDLGARRGMKLAGVLVGYFGVGVPVQTIVTGSRTNNVAFENMGIAAVVPAQKVYEILFSEQEKKRRGED